MLFVDIPVAIFVLLLAYTRRRDLIEVVLYARPRSRVILFGVNLLLAVFFFSADMGVVASLFSLYNALLLVVALLDFSRRMKFIS